MGLIINTELTTADGGTVESGSALKFTALFPMKTNTTLDNENELIFDLKVYRSETDFSDGKTFIRKVIEIPNSYTVILTDLEFAVLTPIKIHEILQEWVLDQLGYANSTSGSSIVQISL